MKTLLWAERLKLKRSKILWITIFSTIMVAFIVFMQGQFLYYGQRYIDGTTWYMTAVQSLGSLYVFPPIIALMGSYIICRENQDNTLKSLLLIPVEIPKLIGTKLIMTAIFSIALYTFIFIIAFTVEAILHISNLNINIIARFIKIYILDGVGMFIAVSPIIAIVYKFKKRYWFALILAEIYSFLGLFAGMQVTIRSIYPITAAFCLSGYYETTPAQLFISIFSLLVCGLFSLLVIFKLGKNDI